MCACLSVLAAGVILIVAVVCIVRVLIRKPVPKETSTTGETEGEQVSSESLRVWCGIELRREAN